ncbi:MAG: malate synthase A [Ardenticatenales bacterium]|nr:malate synthase A [Ardenticatenales bacterium]MCB9172085.1 malate synthase A [Ardenticatenales bacterium]
MVDDVEFDVAEAHVEVLGRLSRDRAHILSDDALAFVAHLHHTFKERRATLLAARTERQARLDAGERLNFLPDTREVRESDWTVAPIPADLQKRHVEITGPVERKMIINALNSGADVFMADIEDSLSPSWENVIDGQINLYDAVRGTIRYTNVAGKQYSLNDKKAVLMVRPRGWHLTERHLCIDGEPVSASLFDFGLYFFHNAQALINNGSGPYFYLPKLESHLEARLWNDVFTLAQEMLGIPHGTIRATVLIETLPAAFEMDEILYELRDHSAGLNCGRWDYIFSVIKSYRNDPDFILPDRALVTMNTHLMHSYSLRTIRVCHKRGIHAMGGMAAQIPIKGDPEANEIAIGKVRADKEREVRDGHDGTWVAHPGLVAVARNAFAQVDGANQIDRSRDDVQVTADDLLTLPEGAITEAGVRTNINVGVQYMEAWLRDNGCVPINNLMEDAATAEISRTQLWQWVHHGATLADGRTVTPELFETLLDEELAGLRESLGSCRYNAGRFDIAGELFREMTLKETLDDFLTLKAYRYLL